MSEYKKNVVWFVLALVIAIAYICIGFFTFPGGTEEQKVFVGTGIFLLVFCAWFFYDALL